MIKLLFSLLIVNHMPTKKQLITNKINKSLLFAEEHNLPFQDRLRKSVKKYDIKHIVGLVERFQGALGGLLLDVFEDTWTYFESYKLNSKAASSNTISLVPIVDERSMLNLGASGASETLQAVSQLPLAFRWPSKDMEVTKKKIHIFICLRMLRYRLGNRQDPIFPAVFSANSTIAKQPTGGTPEEEHKFESSTSQSMITYSVLDEIETCK